MSHGIIYAKLARAQLVTLARTLAREATPAIAARYTDAIIAKCEGLSEFPNRGTPRDDIRPGVRTMPFRRRVLIAYAVKPGTVTILGVFYGGQDFAALLREED